MNSPVISVIIPVYNAEHTLPAAMDSIFLQGIRDIQIILVNDGSRDGSLGICEGYARDDPRVTVIDQENSGPSAACNAGIRAAAGRYLAFLDSDDTLTPGAWARMLEAAEKSGAQKVIGRYNFSMGSRTVVGGRAKEDRVLNRDAFMGEFVKKPASFFFACVWNKLYSREMVAANGIFFDDSITWGEDLHFNMLCARHVNTVAFIKEPVYNYRLTAQGQAARSYFRRPGHVLKVRLLQYRMLRDLYRSTGYYRQHRARIHLFIVDVFV